MARCPKKPRSRIVKAKLLTIWQCNSLSISEDPPQPLTPPRPVEPCPPPDEVDEDTTTPTPQGNGDTSTPEPSEVSSPAPTNLLLIFPQEIIDLILRLVLTSTSVIPVDPLFCKRNMYLPPPLDYRILHSCTMLYGMGIRHYYALNTFSISLSMFSVSPRTVAADRWPLLCGVPMASKFLRTLHVTAREYHNWQHAVQLLQGFTELNKVVFDVREDWSLDSAVDGGVKFGGGWEEVPASDEICEALKGAGVCVGAGGIWVGADTATFAGQIMDGLLVGYIVRGLVA